MPEPRYNTEVHLMEPSNPPVMSSFLNQSKCSSLVLVQNTMKHIKGLNSCIYLFHISVGWGGAILCTIRSKRRQCWCYLSTGSAKVLVHIKESLQNKVSLLRLVDVKYTKRVEKSVFSREGLGNRSRPLMEKGQDGRVRGKIEVAGEKSGGKASGQMEPE